MDSRLVKAWLKLIRLEGLSTRQKRFLVRHFQNPDILFNTQDLPTKTAFSAAWKERFSGLVKSQEKTPIRPQALNKVINHLCDLAFEDHSRDLVDQGLNSALSRESPGQVGYWHDQLIATKTDFIPFNHPDFPSLLNEISDPPLGLFYKGRIELITRPQIAIIGSRNPSPSGQKTTFSFAKGLTERGFVITSGMACGIDSYAHHGALGGQGDTIAVVGTGLDIIYPKSNNALFHRLCDNALVISEYPPGTPARKAHFPQRNRIISGLSLGTLVVEAGLRSGSLITARLAGEQGREVFAIPGPIHQPTSRGCHRLIRQGAKLVETLDDILEELGQYANLYPPAHLADRPQETPSLGSNEDNNLDDLPDKTAQVFAQIDYAPASFDELMTRSGLTLDQISSILMDLELRGLVAETVDGYQRIPNI